MADNWYIVIALGSVALVIVSGLINWLKLPNNQKINDIKQLCRYFVLEAEKALKGGTGQAKLLLTYDMFLTRFPELRNYITFEMFSDWIDEALEWLNVQLESNKSIREYCYGVEDSVKAD